MDVVLDVVGDILEGVIRDFSARSGRRPLAIVLQDDGALLAIQFKRNERLSKKPRKMNFEGVEIGSSATMPRNVAIAFIENQSKPYGFIYHIGRSGKRGVVKILNAKEGAYPALRLPSDLVHIQW